MSFKPPHGPTLPKVSVLMPAYNHAPFIAQALESVLTQKADFPFEIVVGEDKSNDETRRIIEDYRLRFPQRIRLLARERNLGMHRNFVETYQECRGEYIALLEGDDYWTDPTKLQRQVDFLEAHMDYVISFHDALVVGNHNRAQPWRWCTFKKKSSGFRELSYGLFIPTCSSVLRNGVIKNFPPWFYDLPMVDWPLLLLAAEHGKIHFTNRVMAHYRRHDGGIWAGSSDLKNSYKMLSACEILGQAFPKTAPSGFAVARFLCWCDLAVKHSLADEFELVSAYKNKARRFALRHFRAIFADPTARWIPLVKVLARLFFTKTPRHARKKQLALTD